MRAASPNAARGSRARLAAAARAGRRAKCRTIATCFARFASSRLELARDLAYLAGPAVPDQGDHSRAGAADDLRAVRAGPTCTFARRAARPGPARRSTTRNEALDWTAAVNLVSLEWAGKRPHMREMHLASRFPETFPWRDRLKERIKALVLNRVNMFTDNFDPPGLDEAWRQIRRRAPVLDSGPSVHALRAGHASARARHRRAGA